MCTEPLEKLLVKGEEEEEEEEKEEEEEEEGGTRDWHLDNCMHTCTS